MDEIDTAGDTALREQIGAMLDGGLETEVFPRADESDKVNAIVTRLRTEAGGDLSRKLVVSGMANHPIDVGELRQECESCMYHLLHRGFCELPELDLPVKPNWSCRLWRI